MLCVWPWVLRPFSAHVSAQEQSEAELEGLYQNTPRDLPEMFAPSRGLQEDRGSPDLRQDCSWAEVCGAHGLTCRTALGGFGSGPGMEILVALEHSRSVCWLLTICHLTIGLS